MMEKMHMSAFQVGIALSPPTPVAASTSAVVIPADSIPPLWDLLHPDLFIDLIFLDFFFSFFIFFDFLRLRPPPRSRAAGPSCSAPEFVIALCNSLSDSIS
jgi:hypothetical protein